ncbi:MAG: ComEA family DNA-binding protein [Candidatus Electronema sp. VV]
MRTDHQPGGELRVPVLLLLAALILAAGWRLPTRHTPPSSYFWAEGKLVRSQAEKGVRLSAGMACADIPAELAAFFSLPLPVNRADQADLMRLPGIGPKLAENIISYREGQGGFAGPDDLIKVKGIGPKRSARLLPLLCFD